jgi:hypothetical protein
MLGEASSNLDLAMTISLQSEDHSPRCPFAQSLA